MFPGSLNGSDPLLRNLAESSPARRRTVSGMQDAYAHGGGDDLETLQSKLEVEKRIEFGAERFLEALDSGSSSIPPEAHPALRTKVTEELRSSYEKIKALQSRIDRFTANHGLHSPTKQRDGILGGGNENRTLLHSPEKLKSPSNNNLNPPPLPPPHPQPPRRGSGHSVSQVFGKVIPKLKSSSALGAQFSGRFRAKSNEEAVGKASPSRKRSYSDTGQDDAFSSSVGASSLGQDLSTEREEEGSSDLNHTFSSGGYESGSNRPNGTASQVDDDGIGAIADATGWATDYYREEVDEAVVVEAVKGASHALEGIARARRGGVVLQENEIGRYLALLTKYARLSSRVKETVDYGDLVEQTFPFVTEDNSSKIKTACYRLYRYFMRDRSSWKLLTARGMEWLIMRTFGRVNRQIPEMEQALKLLRAVFFLPYTQAASNLVDITTDSPFEERGPVTFGTKGAEDYAESAVVSQGIIRVLVSLAENEEDAFQAIGLECLAELAVIDLPALIEADGFRMLLQAIEAGPYHLGSPITSILLDTLDSPATREALPEHSGIDVILAGFTNAYGTGNTHLERLRATAGNVALMLRSWTGLMFASMRGLATLKSLVDCLYVPVTETREVVIDLFVDVFRVVLPEWYHPFLTGKALDSTRRGSKRTVKPIHPRARSSNADGRSPIDQYLSLLLVNLVDAGLIEALAAVVEENTLGLSKKATLLLGEILIKSSDLLPLKYAAKIQTLPKLFDCAAALDDPPRRTAALNALSSINNATRLGAASAKVEQHPGRRRAESTVDPLERGQRQADQARIRLAMQMDDRQFQSALVDSQVLYSKDHTKWNYEILMEIVEGPLLNPKRLEEAFKASKFGRRLMTFFQPLYRRFSDIKRTTANQKWIRLGSALISTLISTEDGIAILTEDKLLRQIVDCFSELDQYAGQPNPQPYFSRNRLEGTLSHGYFDFIRVLSAQEEGMRILEMFNFFTCFYHLCELKSRDDLIRAIIENLDYTSDGHARIILSKGLTSSYMHTRMFATRHLGRLTEQRQAEHWQLELLVTQLYDPAFAVCEAAANYLEGACEDPSLLETVVNLRPTFDHLGNIGQWLFMKFLSSPIGFTYLNRTNYIDREMDEWFQWRNMRYVVQVEAYLQGFANPDMIQRLHDGAAPPHFYGEVTKTPAGCDILRNKGHFPAFARFLREYVEGDGADEQVLHRLKSVLWAVGNIGSTTGGLPFLEDEDIIEIVVELAERSPVLSIRGTAFFSLGLISTTVEGCDILEDYGWTPTISSIGHMTGICLPDDLKDFTELPAWEPYRPGLPLRLPASSVPLEKRMLRDISDLGNYVLATQAMQSLARLRSRHRELFRSLPIYIRALDMLSHEHYKQPVRAFVMDMFDLQLDEATLKKLLDMRQSLLATAKETSKQVEAKTAGGTGNDKALQRSSVHTTGAASGTSSDGKSLAHRAVLRSPKNVVHGFGMPRDAFDDDDDREGEDDDYDNETE